MLVVMCVYVPVHVFVYVYVCVCVCVCLCFKFRKVLFCAQSYLGILSVQVCYSEPFD